MKKKIFNWMTIMMMASMCVGFTSCGGDDDNESVVNYGIGNNPNPANVLVGTWYASWSTDVKGHETLIFRADGTGNESGVNDEESRNPYRWNDNFNYVILNYDAYLGSGSVYIKYSDGEGTRDFMLSNNTLKYRGSTYRKK